MIMRSSIMMLFCLLGLLSCDSKRVFDTYRTTSGGWHKDTIMRFEIPKLDSLQPYNLFINVRNDNTYPYSNLFLVSRMRFPNGKAIIDTLEYEMAAADGTWLGAGFSDLKENKLWYKENVRFIEEGNYSVELLQAMRKNGNIEGDETLEGITDVGFRIEKSQNH